MMVCVEVMGLFLDFVYNFFTVLIKLRLKSVILFIKILVMLL